MSIRTEAQRLARATALCETIMARLRDDRLNLRLLHQVTIALRLCDRISQRIKKHEAARTTNPIPENEDYRD